MNFIVNKLSNKTNKFIAKRKLLFGDEISYCTGFKISDNGNIIVNRLTFSLNKEEYLEYEVFSNSYISFILNSASHYTKDLLVVNTTSGSWFLKVENDMVVFLLVSNLFPSYRLEEDFLYFNNYAVDLSSFTLDTCMYKLPARRRNF